MIDIGANLTNTTFKNDLNAVLDRATNAQLDHIIITGTNIEESQLASELCSSRPGLLSCTAGVHPHDAKYVENNWLDILESLQKDKCVKAVGETGLDFNRNYSPVEKQIEIFQAQLALACRLDKPVFIHDRDTKGETLRILKSFDQHLSAVVIHCFTGNREELSAYLKAGYSIGITGWVCDERRGKVLQSLIPMIPDSKLMLETDAPYLLPRNIKGKPAVKNRCEPEHLTYIVEMVARLRNQSIAEVQQLCTENAQNFFQL
ncbi:MAG: TatD family hydrolase [Pseudomonadales bacterium]|nr:TatD family hydrolase [Pseudomonadales bacterium]